LDCPQQELFSLILQPGFPRANGGQWRPLDNVAPQT
jgi:hypothetical protein